MNKKQLLILYLCVLSIGFQLFGQGRKYEGPDDPAGDIAAERDGYMTGNRVKLFFRNTTELSDWPLEDASLWPNTFEGTRTLDGIGLLVGARVYLRQDTIPVEDPLNYTGTDPLDTLYYCQTSYRQGMDTNPTGDVEWGFYPVFGYFNEESEHPAMSNRPESWPPGGWPAPEGALKWPGEWDGRFGRGIIYADLETYFVVNDAQDQEYLGFEDKVKYYPRPGLKIGDKRPQVTIQKGMPWGGLGLRVEQRGFQWNNPQAKDAIFWEYEIANISNYNLPEVVFGYWVDTWIGGEYDSDDLGFFDTQIDMAYCWDKDGVGLGGRVPGTLGFAYLESPGLPYNGIDDDEDGLTDEARDNEAKNLLGPTEGITDLQKFLDFYRISEEDLREHWDADEDQDWDDGVDLNGDGNYYTLSEDGTYYLDPGEDPGDDVGLDGVGPGELNYYGPDEGEGNHKPDYVQGLGCEPDFNATDVSESDMVGLTSFRMFNIPNENSSYHWPKGDRSMWELLGRHTLIEWAGGLANLILTFASGPFPLFQGHEERISMAELHSYDPLSGLNSSEHSAPSLFEKKRIVQVIYEKDYRFAQPPLMPTLTATPGDGKVILTWDNVADKKTRDPFMGNINDFEGYKLYKATDKLFSDALQITNGKGVLTGLKPVFQCDIADGISGYADYAPVDGALYFLGDETGIVHHYIDTEVQNGRTYYYALVAYDYGSEELGIAPSENKIVIDLDELENIRFSGKNVQIATPRQNALGYIEPHADIDDSSHVLGSGNISPVVLAQNAIQPDHRYMIGFDIDSVYVVPDYPHGLLYTTSHLFVYDITGGDTNQVYSETPSDHVEGNILKNDTLNYYYFNDYRSWSTDVFDGIRLEASTPIKFAQLDWANSGWLKGNGRMTVLTTPEETQYFPWDYEIVFTDNDSAHVSEVSVTSAIRDENGKSRLSNLLKYQAFPFYVINTSFTDNDGNYEIMELMAQDVDGDGAYNPLYDRVFVGAVNNRGRWAGTVFILDFSAAQSEEDLPQPGDIYRITFNRPFYKTDALFFNITPADKADDKVIKSELNKITVVPNPYIATNSMEKSFLNTQLNQDRSLMFTNIPADCKITIFSSSGVLVDRITVNNEPGNGIIHWDLVSKEGLDIAAGIYIYLVETESGDFHKGKFAVIK
ncbi:MAG: hypothetical protein J7L22_11750 [Candidatus Marinimicrobia bacterium]|nr:hypothetical protein [Candidatus Neomarinimicrobiota bacterium]